MPTHLMLCCMIAMLVCSKPLTEKLGDEGVCDLVEYSIDDGKASSFDSLVGECIICVCLFIAVLT